MVEASFALRPVALWLSLPVRERERLTFSGSYYVSDFGDEELLGSHDVATAPTCSTWLRICYPSCRSWLDLDLGERFWGLVVMMPYVLAFPLDSELRINAYMRQCSCGDP